MELKEKIRGFSNILTVCPYMQAGPIPLSTYPCQCTVTTFSALQLWLRTAQYCQVLYWANPVCQLQCVAGFSLCTTAPPLKRAVVPSLLLLLSSQWICVKEYVAPGIQATQCATWYLNTDIMSHVFTMNMRERIRNSTWPATVIQVTHMAHWILISYI